MSRLVIGVPLAEEELAKKSRVPPVLVVSELEKPPANGVNSGGARDALGLV